MKIFKKANKQKENIVQVSPSQGGRFLHSSNITLPNGGSLSFSVYVFSRLVELRYDNCNREAPFVWAASVSLFSEIHMRILNSCQLSTEDIKEAIRRELHDVTDWESAAVRTRKELLENL